MNDHVTTKSRQRLFFGTLALLSGCASTVPDAIRKPPASDIPLSTVRSAPETYRGTTVRWGGMVVSVRNRKDETVIELVYRRLDREGRPREEHQSEGRFLATISGFYDPAVYASDREVTVTGRIEGVIAQAIGEFPYIYTVVRADQVYLWNPRPPPRYVDPDPFSYDPWFPVYPPWPYHRPR